LALKTPSGPDVSLFPVNPHQPALPELSNDFVGSRLDRVNGFVGAIRQDVEAQYRIGEN
jgi:hypothetical protein